jgi:hypothetical protein
MDGSRFGASTSPRVILYRGFNIQRDLSRRLPGMVPGWSETDRWFPPTHASSSPDNAVAKQSR